MLPDDAGLALPASSARQLGPTSRIEGVQEGKARIMSRVAPSVSRRRRGCRHFHAARRNAAEKDHRRLRNLFTASRTVLKMAASGILPPLPSRRRHIGGGRLPGVKSSAVSPDQQARRLINQNSHRGGQLRHLARKRIQIFQSCPFKGALTGQTTFAASSMSSAVVKFSAVQQALPSRRPGRMRMTIGNALPFTARAPPAPAHQRRTHRLLINTASPSGPTSELNAFLIYRCWRRRQRRCRLAVCHR
jgi:hypothetical protein